MPNQSLDEREFELINIVGGELAANQRDLSRQMNLSLGMTNMILRRMVTKGYIRIQQLNQRKVQYLLTPKGFAEKMQKSVKYTLKTINSIGLIKSHLGRILKKFYDQGQKKFYILGESDLAGLVEIVLKEHFKQDYQTTHIESIGESQADGVVLVCKEGIAIGQAKGRIVNLIEELAQDKELTAHGLKEL